MQKLKKAILFLEDGLFFIGKSLGKSGETFGEVCFNTGMTGYQEILTDPSYSNQMIAMSSPHKEIMGPIIAIPNLKEFMLQAL